MSYKFNPFTGSLDLVDVTALPLDHTDPTKISNVGVNTHGAIDTHIADATKHFTMLDEDDLSSDSETQAATQQSIKAYIDALCTNPEKSYTISPSGGDYTSIQAALDANTSGGELFIVYPGTYTDTINFTADNQCIAGIARPPQIIVTQADSTICDFGAHTDCRIVNIQLQVSAATTAIPVVTGSGEIKLFVCRLNMTSSANIAGVSQPSIFSGTGTIIVDHSIMKYIHTGNCTAGGGGSFKSAIIQGAGSSIIFCYSDLDIECSGTAFGTTLSYGDNSGTCVIDRCDIDVLDDDADITGAIYIAGSISGETEYNDIYVRNDTNNAYGFYIAGTVNQVVTGNNIKIESSGGNARSFYVGATATVNSHMNHIVAADGKTVNGTLNIVGSEEEGKLIISDSLNIGDTTEVSGILDEDDMASDSATDLCTQQSIKKYVDDNAGGGGLGYSDGADNRIVTFTDADNVHGEANFTFDGSKLLLTGSMYMTEQAAAAADTAGQGQLWVKNAAPNELWFTDDTGTDTNLLTSAAGFDPDVDAFDIGSDAVASGTSGIGLGHDANSTGDEAIAIGYAAQATQNSAVAIGDSADSDGVWAIAIGDASSIDLSGTDGVAIGRSATITANRCVVIGATSSSGNVGGICLGWDAIVSANYGIAIGYNSDATAANGICLGQGTDATGISAIAIGVGSQSTSTDTIAIGEGATASADGCIAIGDAATASADRAISIGDNTTALAAYTVALGNGADATQIGTIAIGGNAQASVSTYGIAMGYYSIASGGQSVAIGRGAVASGTSSTAVCYNTDATGNFSSALGYAAQATGDHSTAFGSSANASAGSTTCIGRSTVASGAQAIAIGYHADSTNTGSLAMGGNAQATASYSIGIGQSANAAHTDSVCIGKDSATTLNNQIVLGDSTNTCVYITGSFVMKEQADGLADVAGYGQLWVKNTTPCELWFTDDAGTDTQIV